MHTVFARDWGPAGFGARVPVTAFLQPILWHSCKYGQHFLLRALDVRTEAGGRPFGNSVTTRTTMSSQRLSKLLSALRTIAISGRNT
jgi:hypothetical protein